MLRRSNGRTTELPELFCNFRAMKNPYFTAVQGSTKAAFFAMLLSVVFTPLFLAGQSESLSEGAGTYAPGIAHVDRYYSLLSGKRVAVVANATSLLPDGTHTVDHLLNLGVEVHEVWAPEHGFRGEAAAGEWVSDAVDGKTGLPIRSLYGKTKRPLNDWLEGLDFVLFDIQDVGVRFYTYSTTLSYVLDACLETGVPLVVFDRANPNGHYVDGPLLAAGFESMVGLHPIPVVHGLTMGEYARVVLEKAWVPQATSAKIEHFERAGGLHIIACSGYSHREKYSGFQVPPSPNLRSSEAIALYPSLCFFEGTPVSCGRGTEQPFTRFGAPWLPAASFPHEFVPMPDVGSARPKFQGQRCHGASLSSLKAGGLEVNETEKSPWMLDGKPFVPKDDRIHWEPLFEVYAAWMAQVAGTQPQEGKQSGAAQGGQPMERVVNEPFFSSFFSLLAGSKRLQNALEAGWSIERWQESYADEVSDYRALVRPYLLYDSWN